MAHETSKDVVSRTNIYWCLATLWRWCYKRPRALPILAGSHGYSRGVVIIWKARKGVRDWDISENDLRLLVVKYYEVSLGRVLFCC